MKMEEGVMLLMQLEVIKKVNDSVLRDYYIKKVSKLTHMDESIISKGVSTKPIINQEQNGNRNANFILGKKKKSKTFIIETRLLYLALCNKRNFDRIFELISFDDIQSSVVKKIMIFLIGYYQVIDRFILKECIDHLSIDEIKYIQQVLEYSVKPLDENKEVQMSAKTFEK